MEQLQEPTKPKSSSPVQKSTKINYFKSILEEYYRQNNLGDVPFNVSSVDNEFMAGILLSAQESWGTYPQSFRSEAEAMEAVSKMCVEEMDIVSKLSMSLDKMNIQKDDSSDNGKIVYRIEQLIKGKNDGTFSSEMEKLYKEKYGEKLPSLWWEKMSLNLDVVQPFSAGSDEVIIFPIPAKNI